MAALHHSDSNTPIKRLGYGAMVLEGFYGAVTEEQSVTVLRHAIDNELMIDTADAYGGGHNEILVGQAISNQRSKAFIASKFGIIFEEGHSGSEVPTGWGYSLNVNGSGEYMRHCLHNTLQRLGTDYLDLYYAHFADPNIPIEETVGAMADTVAEGKVRYLGLSNVTAEQVRRAHAVHPIAAVQYEYSLWRREAEVDLLPTLRELGINLVAWSPLGSGFLTGNVEQLPEGDFRNNNPRFSSENLSSNKDRFGPLKAIAQELDATPAQLVLAWLLHQGDDVLAIPGSRKVERVDENSGALELQLSDELLAIIDSQFELGCAQGQTMI